MQLSLLLPALFSQLLLGATALSGAQQQPPALIPPPAPAVLKPAFPPSYRVHISPSQSKGNGTSSTSGPGYWAANGFELDHLLTQLYGISVKRMEFADPSLSRARYDVALVLPQPATEASMKLRIRQALAARLHLSIQVVPRLEDVYVVTAPRGPGPKLRRTHDLGGAIATSELIEAPSPHGLPRPTAEDIEHLLAAARARAGIAIDSIEMSSGTPATFCDALEQSADRPVVDETHLNGTYSVELPQQTSHAQLILERMQSELGLVVQPARRTIRTLVIQPE